MARGAVLAALVAGAASCKKKEPPPPRPPIDAAPAAASPAQPLPGGAADGAIGGTGEVELVAAADDGAWVAICQQDRPGHEVLRVVVGDGPGLEARWLVAATDRDLAVLTADALVHVDAVARTARVLGPHAPVAIDRDSRRLVQAEGATVIVRDPGVAPRTVDAGGEVERLSLRGRRWLSVHRGTPARQPDYSSCGWVQPGYAKPVADATIDLDPSGVEALERVGPELGVTAAGEVTLDGARVAPAECVGNVIAALAEPPRALVMCNEGRNHVVGPGLDREVGGTLGGGREQAQISEQLVLGRRVVCVTGACIDLVSGRDFGTYDTPIVWAGERFVVRKRGGNLLVDELDHERQREVVLPRLTQAVTVDTATGRRVAGAAPTPPAFIDAAGRFLLYGRHVVDVEDARLVATLADDALAIDTAGRVLAVDPRDRRLRWRRP